MTKKTILSAVAVAALAAAALLAFAAGRSAYAGVQGITLDPPAATNDVGTDHMVTATVSGVAPGQQVVFAVTSGPNQGAHLTCSANVDCTTDGSNQVSGTYTGDGGTGQDTIEACIQLIGVQAPPCATATKDWVQPTPTPTPTPSATPTPTPTPTQAPAAELPATGAQPPAGSGFPWLLAGIVALGALAVGAGGVLLRRRAN
ncbi:MAG TPA: hypothetical protein VJ253_08095 [Dehalococcoidia bacterium]|nr:hypothetical protein [Dehalococcoidia bacterium]